MNSLPRWLISITDMPLPCQSSISSAACRSTDSGSTAGPALKLKTRGMAGLRGRGRGDRSGGRATSAPPADGARQHGRGLSMLRCADGAVLGRERRARRTTDRRTQTRQQLALAGARQRDGAAAVAAQPAAADEVEIELV